MARIAPPRWRALLFVAVLLPLWSSYLVRIYAWRTILAKNGALNWVLNGLGLPDAGLAYTNTAMWIVFSYVWLPFMVLPVYAALERIPDSYLEASQDLGAKGSRTLRSVILPLPIPGIVAGSIFTFSLTLGDFITPALVGGAGSSFIGNIVEEKVGQPDIPFAAAFATVPVVVMGIYLLMARRLGAFEAVSWPPRRHPPCLCRAITRRRAASSVVPVSRIRALPASFSGLVLAPQRRGKVTGAAT